MVRLCVESLPVARALLENDVCMCILYCQLLYIMLSFECCSCCYRSVFQRAHLSVGYLCHATQLLHIEWMHANCMQVVSFVRPAYTYSERRMYMHAIAETTTPCDVGPEQLEPQPTLCGCWLGPDGYVFIPFRCSWDVFVVTMYG